MEETEQASKPDSDMTEVLKLSDWEFKTIIINTPMAAIRWVGAPGYLSQLSVLSLDLGSGHDLEVHEMEPHVRLYADSAEPA